MNEEEKKSALKASGGSGGNATTPRAYADTDNGAETDSVEEPDNALPATTLEELPTLLRVACSKAGWTQLMPVQAKGIPYMMAGRDLMVQSRTGSGKTGAYLLPIMNMIDTRRVACQALVLAPTRELAHQVTNESELLAAGSGLRTVAVYGGAAYGPQIEGFKKGAHLVVGTPGRILDHLLKGTLSLSALKILVFDEADRMLSMGFYPDMKRMQTFLPNHGVHGYMFSATFPPHVMKLAKQFLQRPDFLSLSKDHVHVADTEHVFYIVPPMKKERSLVKIIEVENPVSAIIFCNTKTNVHYVSVVLDRFGYDADELSADLTQAARERVMAKIRRGALRFLVATDVAARGIDIPELSHVIQYEPGEDPESYIHRAGRTGRAGAAGVAITLVAGMEEIRLKENVKPYGIDLVERNLPTDEEVETLVAQRVTAMLEADLRSRDSLKSERMRRFIPLAMNLSNIEDEAALVAMLLDDYYQKLLHGPPLGPDKKVESVEREHPAQVREPKRRRPYAERRRH